MAYLDPMVGSGNKTILFHNVDNRLSVNGLVQFHARFGPDSGTQSAPDVRGSTSDIYGFTDHSASDQSLI